MNNNNIHTYNVVHFLFQLQDSQQRQMSNDMEINMLQHQVLDLQSASDNKAIIAR